MMIVRVKRKCKLDVVANPKSELHKCIHVLPPYLVAVRGSAEVIVYDACRDEDGNLDHDTESCALPVAALKAKGEEIVIDSGSGSAVTEDGATYPLEKTWMRIGAVERTWSGYGADKDGDENSAMALDSDLLIRALTALGKGLVQIQIGFNKDRYSALEVRGRNGCALISGLRDYEATRPPFLSGSINDAETKTKE